MARRRRIYEGKAKVLFEGPEPGTLVPVLQGRCQRIQQSETRRHHRKGVLNNRISEYLMLRLGEVSIPTHLVQPV